MQCGVARSIMWVRRATPAILDPVVVRTDKEACVAHRCSVPSAASADVERPRARPGGRGPRRSLRRDTAGRHRSTRPRHRRRRRRLPARARGHRHRRRRLAAAAVTSLINAIIIELFIIYHVIN